MQRANLDAAVHRAARPDGAHVAVPSQRRSHDGGVSLGQAQVRDPKIRPSFDRCSERRFRLELDRPVASNGRDHAQERPSSREADAELRQIENVEPMNPRGDRCEGGEIGDMTLDLI